MASPKKSSKKNSKKNEAIEETSASIEAQMAQFLAEGGEIQQIPRGVSGQVATTGPRHITLGKRNQASS